jgi:ubiquinone/menaquinone biosynthesis C-methylase UbiE
MRASKNRAAKAEGTGIMHYSESAGANLESFRDTETHPALSAAAPARTRSPVIPDYLQRTYRWAYLDARNAKYLDHELVVKTILWRQHRRLERVAFTEIEPGQHVLQSACVYGNFSLALAEHIGPEGKLEIVDVAEVQVRNCRDKLAGYKHAIVRHEDVLHLRDEAVDTVCCYFLMHELPDDYKRGVAATLLNSVRPGGKVVFVDYHKPHWAHPLKIVTSLIFDTLEPYAKGLWRKEIAAFGANDDRFEWRKETYFGGLYQKVVATHRE